jgi:hypothetical protein
MRPTQEYSISCSVARAGYPDVACRYAHFKGWGAGGLHAIGSARMTGEGGGAGDCPEKYACSLLFSY